ncbi:MAG: AarF/ABC1/UbiB kinase family protein [bacterium]|nr:AarF/ABC1/UbiB kinase family protein [bacterium]
MLHENLIPTHLIQPSEQKTIPIVKDELKTSFRRFRIAIDLSKILLQCVCLALIRRLTVRTVGRIMADFCQKNGVLWIKLGQLLSMRSDLFPSDLCEELGRLQDRVEGFSPQLAKKVIEQEIGAPLESFFTHFVMEPCAAASIAQVHKAFLTDEETWVAIKVRRPEVDQIFSRDMGMIRWLFMLLHRFSIMPYMRWPDMLAEMEQVFTEELDYRYEVANQQRLRKTLAHHNMYVPKVFERYCTHKIMVMEYIEGVAISDFLRLLKDDPDGTQSWMAENGIQPEKIGRTLFLSYLRQLLEDNLFHADLHPGNIVLLRDNSISLLDFGSVGTSEGDLLRKYDIFLQALASGQFAKAVDVFLLIMPFVPLSKLSRVKDDMQRRLHAWDNRCRVKELPYKEKSTNMIFDEMMKVMGRYSITINWAFFKISRGWTTMDTSLRQLIPEADLARLMQSYIQRRKKREFEQAKQQLPYDMLQLQNVLDFPREFSEMAIYRGTSVRRLAQVFEGTATRVSRLVATAFDMGSAFFFMLSVIAGCVFLTQHTEMLHFLTGQKIREILSIFPSLDPQVWLVFIAILLKSLFSLTKLARRFRKQA